MGRRAHRLVKLGAREHGAVFGINGTGFGRLRLVEQVSIQGHSSTVPRQ
jgi:hypothetical protein